MIACMKHGRSCIVDEGSAFFFSRSSFTQGGAFRSAVVGVWPMAGEASMRQDCRKELMRRRSRMLIIRYKINVLEKHIQSTGPPFFCDKVLDSALAHKVEAQVLVVATDFLVCSVTDLNHFIEYHDVNWHTLIVPLLEDRDIAFLQANCIGQQVKHLEN